MSTAFNWAQECQYIANMADVFHGRRAPDDTHNPSDFNQDPEVFIGYCRMQSKAAHRVGRHDSVTYIEQVIDDIEGVKS